METGPVAQGTYSQKSGYLAAAKFLKGKKPDLIFCANDRMALGLIGGLREKGIRVPRDMKVIGFDDQEVSRITEPHITTIANPFFEIGERAAHKLIALISGERVQGESVPSRLIVRETA